jgi:hypothetical protein
MTKAVQRQVGDVNLAGDEIIQIKNHRTFIVMCNACGMLYEVCRNVFSRTKNCERCRIKRLNDSARKRHENKRHTNVTPVKTELKERTIDKDDRDPFELSKILDPVAMWQRIRKHKNDESLREIALSQRRS